jgi:tRNA modification GTPase
MVSHLINNDTIVALASPQGAGAIAIIRLSGYDAIKICDQVFTKKGKAPRPLLMQKSHTLHFGNISNGDYIIDEVLVSLFFAPHSYTGENIVEVSCHGSVFIQQQIIQLFIKRGARLAQPGEFTLRAFLNKKLDLSQAEAVADLISSNSATSHQVAMMHMRGGFSNKIKTLRQELVDFAALIELELDFSEEDVEFANRDDLKKLVLTIQSVINKLITSFEVGNVIKNGIPVAIVGKPNAGKSTLLNTLLQEERAIVSEIPGTTRDTIEDEVTLGGVLFRFIDTAGLRNTTDTIEAIGVTKAIEKLKEATIVIYLFDVNEISARELELNLEELRKHNSRSEMIAVGNKIDTDTEQYIRKEFASVNDLIFISAKNQENIEELKNKLVSIFDKNTINVPETVVTNARHVEALSNASHALERVFEGLNSNISGDLVAMDIRDALHYLGLINGEITTDDLLGSIFTRFCIGK